MSVLVIDTSGETCAAALASDIAAGAGARILAAETLPLKRGHAEALMPQIERVLAAAGGIAGAGLEAIAVVAGPGSFTGLRVGLAAAQGLGLALSIPVIGLNAFDIVREMLSGITSAHPLLIALDSRREEPFFQAFDAAGGTLTEPLALPVAAMVARLPAGPLYLAGSAAAAVRAAVPDRNWLEARVAATLDISVAARVACAQLLGGHTLPPQPLYLRAPDVTMPQAAPAAARGQG
ncbi:tRNA (adenosine(37)-N6)-threonylcarbamoyltransferase complex dimerization subunit type 1 TsaB [Radicibacter daui]|uniref:tRNA (adenosine(37)-N6)-threonylcarbamoyltransferase complex dimerization subunit type 1 TsaB n=1 Tax=Radicibacter daui TaxID=3064829 RepID=UPI0040469A3B